MKCSAFKQVIARPCTKGRSVSAERQLSFKQTRHQSKHPPVTAMQRLAQGLPTQQQGRTSRVYLKVHMKWGCKTLWEKSYARTTLPTGSCLVCQEACRLLWSSWDKLFLLTHRVEFTQWSLSHHFCKSRWGPTDDGEKLENSKPKASESQPKK